jgi:hypothetical protein
MHDVSPHDGRDAVSVVSREASVVTVSAAGSDPDRVMVFGQGLSPEGSELSIGARVLAGDLAATTGRGVDVTAVPWSSGTPLAVAAQGVDCANYDVLILALDEQSTRDRTASGIVLDLAAAIDVFEPHVDPAARFVVPIPCGADHGFIAAALRATGPRIASIAVGADRVAACAESVALVATLLDEQRERGDSPQQHRDARQPDQQRYDAVRRLDIVDTPQEERFDRIVTAMGQLFRTRGAAINFLPEGRQWTKAGTGAAAVRGDMSLEQSFCKTTVVGSGPLVVGDAHDHADVFPQSDVRFYAGYPIETLDGVRVGAVCVFDSEPRDEQSVELDLLRDFAVLVRAELYRR